MFISRIISVLMCVAALFAAAATNVAPHKGPAGGVVIPLDSMSQLSAGELMALGEDRFRKEDYDVALNAFAIVCRRYDSKAPQEEQRAFAKAFNRYGNILYKRGAYSLAMDSYLQMRMIAENHGLDKELAMCYVRIGNIYAACGDYSGATDFYGRALASDVLREDADVYAMTLNNLFASNLLGGNVGEAGKYLDRYREEFGGKDSTPRHEFDILLGEGLMANAGGDYAGANRYFVKALDCAVRENLPLLCEGSVYSSMAEAYQNGGKSDSALVCLRKARVIAERSGNGRLVVETLKDMADFFERRCMADSATCYKGEYLNLADSISYQEEVNKLKSSQMLYELDKSAYTIRNLSMEKKTQTTVIWVVAVAAAVCVVLVVILVVQNKKLRAAWADLYERSSRQLAEDMEHKKHLIAAGTPCQECGEVRDGDKDSAGNSSGGNNTDDTQRRRMSMDADMKNKIATAILTYLDNSDGYCSSDFSLDRLSEEIGYNPRYVSEVVNVVFQKNFRALLNEYRVRKAMLRLQDTEHYGNYTIKAISESVGYKSQATFISVFTNITGLKPGIYQRLARDKRQDPESGGAC